MPLHSYWVVTADSLHVFEFRFWYATGLRRELGPWACKDLSAIAGEEPNSMIVQLPGEARSYTMQGDRFTLGEAEVVRLLTRR
jgi:hypothetical protein